MTRFFHFLSGQIYKTSGQIYKTSGQIYKMWTNRKNLLRVAHLGLHVSKKIRIFVAPITTNLRVNIVCNVYQ